MAICPVCQQEMELFQDNGEAVFWKCPNGEIYMGTGVAQLVPVPTPKVINEVVIQIPEDERNVVISDPDPENNYERIISITRNGDGNLEITVKKNN